MQLSLYASPHFQTCGILTVMTSESARVISVHMSFLQLNDMESVTSVAMIDKTSSGLTCVIIRTLCILH